MGEKPSRLDEFYTFFDGDIEKRLEQLIGFGTGRNIQVHAEWLAVGQVMRLAQLFAEILRCRKRPGRHESDTPCPGHGGDVFGICQPHHPAAHDWMVDPEQVRDTCTEGLRLHRLFPENRAALFEKRGGTFEKFVGTEAPCLGQCLHFQRFFQLYRGKTKLLLGDGKSERRHLRQF